MDGNELLQIISETTSTVISIVHTSVERVGVQSAVKLREGIEDGASSTESEEESLENGPRKFTVEEQIQYNLVITNIMRLMSLQRADVNAYCVQCLSTLLDLLGKEATIVKYEGPQLTISQYLKLCDAEDMEHNTVLDKLSQVISILYKNVNV